MKEVVLEVKDVSKSFLINRGRETGFKETIAHLFSGRNNKGDTFWALNDVSFELNRGDVLGVIGKNGAGKSTLLRILSSITQPDTGEVKFYGRPASILDIGAGFHPELSGRENIFLSTKLYGLTNAQIEQAYDGIVEFSEIGEFINEPIKNYSAGMYLRLAFAVITFLNADILIFDEVLSVGDAGFQDKIMKYLMERITANEAIIVVSHNMDLLSRICNRFMLLENGQSPAIGGHEIINQYLFHESQKEKAKPAVIRLRNELKQDIGNVFLDEVWVEADKADKEAPFYLDDALEFKVNFKVTPNTISHLDWVFSISTINGINLASDSQLYRKDQDTIANDYAAGGDFQIVWRIPPFFFNYGYFYLNIYCGDGSKILFAEAAKALFFEVKQPLWESGRAYGSKAHSMLRPALDWKITRLG